MTTDAELAALRARIDMGSEERRKVLRENADNVRALIEEAREEGSDDVVRQVERLLEGVLGDEHAQL